MVRIAALLLLQREDRVTQTASSTADDAGQPKERKIPRNRARRAARRRHARDVPRALGAAQDQVAPRDGTPRRIVPAGRCTVLGAYDRPRASPPLHPGTARRAACPSSCGNVIKHAACTHYPVVQSGPLLLDHGLRTGQHETRAERAVDRRRSGRVSGGCPSPPYRGAPTGHRPPGSPAYRTGGYCTRPSSQARACS